MGWEKASGEVGPERGWVECEPTCEKRVLDHACANGNKNAIL